MRVLYALSPIDCTDSQVASIGILPCTESSTMGRLNIWTPPPSARPQARYTKTRDNSFDTYTVDLHDSHYMYITAHFKLPLQLSAPRLEGSRRTYVPPSEKNGSYPGYPRWNPTLLEQC